MFSGLEKSILETVAYFSLFDYPLTAVEIALYLRKDKQAQKAVSLSQIISALEGPGLSQKIGNSQGFFYLSGKEATIAKRLTRYNQADQKYKKAFRAIKVFSALPSVRSVMICNSLSVNNAAAESDIDLFLIIKPDAIWTTRLMLIALSELLGTRIHTNDSADKLCLSFFTCVGNYDFKNIQIPGQDIYLFHWIAGLAPVFGREEYLRFMAENNYFSGQLANYLPKQLSSRRQAKPSRIWRVLLTPVFYGLQLFESVWRKFQWNRLAGHKRELAVSEGTEVIINDKMLKFHDNDRRWLYQQQYNRLTAELLNNA